MMKHWDLLFDSGFNSDSGLRSFTCCHAMLLSTSERCVTAVTQRWIVKLAMN